MANSTKSKHTTVYFVSGPTAVTKILGVRSFSSPETSVSRIDTSSFDDDFNQYVSGRKDVGEISFEIIFDATDHDTLIDYVNSGSETEFMMLAPASDTAAATAPTAASSVFAAYSTVDNVKFRGYISKFQVDTQDNNVWMGRVSIQGTGTVTFTAAP
jgi:hypothetical protein